MAIIKEVKFSQGTDADSKALIRSMHSSELFFAVVGPVGAGGSRAIASLKRVCEELGYECEWIKASNLIRHWAERSGIEVPPALPKTLDLITALQDLGDRVREKDAAQVSKEVMREIMRIRAEKTGQTFQPGQAVVPDEKKRVYLIDSIRHPAEIHLLRRTYGNAFALVGVVCEEGERRRRILGKYFTTPQQLDPMIGRQVDAFMQRDSDDSVKKHGQHVTEAFHEADFFVDNTISDETDSRHLLDDSLGRLVSIIAHDRIQRPSIEESAMHHAHSARVRSACLSRQVGAALVDADGTVVATGTNEVPAPGGGVYGERFNAAGHVHEDHRCAFGEAPFCSSNREQNTIIEELIRTLPELKDVVKREDLSDRIRKTRLGGLIEFSRAVHAEMDALLSAGREGVSTIGTRLFVTTFPCHYCARHIVSAGVFEVQYIEPYPKSLAIKLHRDAIEVNPSNWQPPEYPRSAKSDGSAGSPKVLFRPFVGVAPRMYVRAFEKTWQLKNKTTGEMELKAPEWGGDWSSLTVGYPDLEAILAR